MPARAAVALTSLDRVLYPAVGFTKGDLVAYYERVAPLLLPHLAGRALTLGRWPRGVDEPGFAQTECRGRPPWMATRAVTLRDGRVREFCVINDLDSLRWVANQSAIELHVAARADEVVLDLDPGPGAGMADCCRVALALRGGDAWVKLTGSAGLHVHIPFDGDFAEAKAFARSRAAQLAAADPARVTDGMRADRSGRVFVDWTLNDPSRTVIAPYSLRATDLPTIAAPISWDEVSSGPRPRRADRP